MVAKHSPNAGLGNEAARNSTICRYKTGKCLNTRSRKRNGQPHQLCLYHRDKANMTQRKFDRQKRHNARSRKGRHAKISTSATLVDNSVLTKTTKSVVYPLGPTSSTSFSAAGSSTTSNGAKMYSPDAPDCSLNESVWADLPVASSLCSLEYLDMPLPMNWHQSYLSTDEIDFLCSAILE